MLQRSAAFPSALGQHPLVWRIVRWIRIARRVADDEVVRVTLQDRDGAVLFEGEVRVVWALRRLRGQSAQRSAAPHAVGIGCVRRGFDLGTAPEPP